MGRRRGERAACALAAVGFFVQSAAIAAASDRVVVRFAAAASADERKHLRATAGTHLLGALTGLPRTQVLASPDARASVRTLERSPLVVWAERDVRLEVVAIPSDPRFGEQWALHNTGQQVDGGPATADADMDVPEAWDLTVGKPPATVAVIDTGVALTHPDLAPSIWRNPGEIGDGREDNGVDDDSNGLIDDWHGWDWLDDDNEPLDHNGHGTHVASTIGAIGNDAVGISGVAPNSRLMALRVLDHLGGGWASDIGQAIAYAGRSGAHVANLSLGGPFSHAIDDAIAGNPQMLIVTGAGNSGEDNADVDSYPCELPHQNVLCVAASDQHDLLAEFSNFGSSVDLAAPGTHILGADPARRTLVREDFESADLSRWGVLNGWQRSTTQASSGRFSLATTVPASNLPQDFRKAETTIDLSRPDACRGEVRMWLEGGERDILSVGGEGAGAPGEPPWLAQTFGGPGAPRGELRELRMAGMQRNAGHAGARLWVQLERWEQGAVTGAIDDLVITCVEAAGRPGEMFRSESGTSMAAALTSGAAALLYGLQPKAAPAAVARALVETVDRKPAFAGKVSSGGRLNVGAAVARPLESGSGAAPEDPGPTGTIPEADGWRPGSPDPSFAGGGFASAPFELYAGYRLDSEGQEILSQADGRTLVVGGGHGSLVVARFRADGTLDDSFGNRGRISHAVRPGGSDQVTTFVFGGAGRQEDGKIVVAGGVYGHAPEPREDLVVLRLLPDGQLDHTFGSGGLAVHRVKDGGSKATDVAIDELGRIILPASTNWGPLALLRLLPHGGLDPTFGSGGIAATPHPDADGDGAAISEGERYLTPHEVALQGDGKILVGGWGYDPEVTLVALRFLPDGRLDLGFGDDGIVATVPFGPTALHHTSLALGPDGRPVLAGVVYGSGVRELELAVTRLHRDGRPDQRFGLNGVVYTAIGSSAGQSVLRVDVGVLADGRVVATAEGSPGALVRYLPDGRLDPGFGSAGKRSIPSEFRPTELAVDSQGRVLVTGNLEGDLALARYLGGRLSEAGPQPGPSATPSATPEASPQPPAEGEPAREDSTPSNSPSPSPSSSASPPPRVDAPGRPVRTAARVRLRLRVGRHGVRVRISCSGRGRCLGHLRFVERTVRRSHRRWRFNVKSGRSQLRTLPLPERTGDQGIELLAFGSQGDLLARARALPRR